MPGMRAIDPSSRAAKNFFRRSRNKGSINDIEAKLGLRSIFD